MTPASKTILFFGTEDFSALTLEALIAHNFTIGAIITKPDARRGRHGTLTKPRVKEIGEAHDIPVWQPSKLSDIADDIAEFDSPVGVLVSFGKIIPQSIIDLFTPGIINLHPSLLPKYRGPSPIESAILNGDETTGISIMQLSAAMDAGPVYLQEPYPLSQAETAPELYETLGQRGSELLVNALSHITDGTLTPFPQDDSAANYCSLLTKQDGVIDWNKPAEQLEREIRAYKNWPGSRTTIGGIELIITSAQVATGAFGAPGTFKIEDADTLLIQTGDQALRLLAVKPVGKKEMPIQAFLAGYSHKLAS